jgi:hypothetical protein
VFACAAREKKIEGRGGGGRGGSSKLVVGTLSVSTKRCDKNMRAEKFGLSLAVAAAQQHSLKKKGEEVHTIITAIIIISYEPYQQLPV